MASPKTPKALEPVARKVEVELESLASDNVTDPVRIAQVVRRTVGKWVGGDLPPPADDRADGHRNLVLPNGVLIVRLRDRWGGSGVIGHHIL